MRWSECARNAGPRVAARAMAGQRRLGRVCVDEAEARVARVTPVPAPAIAYPAARPCRHPRQMRKTTPNLDVLSGKARTVLVLGTPTNGGVSSDNDR
jgi:hypothetical protein